METTVFKDSDSEIFDFPTSCEAIPPKKKNCIVDFVEAEKPPTSLVDYTDCLKDIYEKYNVGLSSSAAVEQVFSVCGDILRKKRNALSQENFERAVMFKYALKYNVRFKDLLKNVNLDQHEEDLINFDENEIEI